MEQQDKTTRDAQEIRSQMDSIRTRSKQQKLQFVDDSARMLDWKEHVRAMPVTAVVASVVVGFSLLYKNTPTKSNAKATPEPAPQPVRSFFATSASQPPPKKAANMSPLMSAAMSMATSVLLSSGKQFLMKNIQSILSDTNHERQSKPTVSGEDTRPKEWRS